MGSSSTSFGTHTQVGRGCTVPALLASGFACSPAVTTMVYLAGGGSGLVDLLVAANLLRGAHLDGGPHVLELEVTGISIEAVEAVAEEAETVAEEAETVVEEALAISQYSLPP